MKKTLKIVVALLSMYSVSNFALANGQKISEIFSYEMIDADVAYLESLIGPARKTDEILKEKIYIVDNCKLTVGYNGLNINTLKVETGEKCNFSLKNIVPSKKNILTNKLEFGLSGPVTYYSDCLMDCGNSYAPEIYELYEGSRSENWRELLISSVNANDGKWRDFMVKKEGREWVEEKKFNCEPGKYNEIANTMLKGKKAETIMIGYQLVNLAGLQSGCNENLDEYQVSQPTLVNQQIEQLTEIPFQEIYKYDDRNRDSGFGSNIRHYIGSQLISGTLLYEPNDMYNYYFNFEVRADQENLLPKPARGYNFILNDSIGMSEQETSIAANYLGIKTDLTDPKFRANNCAITGPITLQITNISLDMPGSAEHFTYMKSLHVIESGPFRMLCTENK